MDFTIGSRPKQFDINKFQDKFSMIFATSENGMIGKDNKLLWHLPNDLKRFKKLTSNKIIIMGRKTFDSLPNGPLPGRLNIVMCNDDEDFLKEPIIIDKSNTGLVKLSSIQEVFNFIYIYEQKPSMPKITTDEFFVIGGGIIYELFLPFIKTLHLTVVHTDIEGDTMMPNINKFEWEEIEEIENKIDDNHKYDYDFVTLKRIR